MAIQDKIAEIKAKLSILDVAKHLGLEVHKDQTLCLWHDDHNPSLKLKDAFFKCFVCGEGGDIFKLTMRAKNLEFRDAFEDLAGYAGISLETGKYTSKRSHILADAKNFFHTHKRTQEENEKWKAFISERQISEAAIKEFELGIVYNGDSPLRICS